MIEVWKDVPGFNGRYQCSNFGRIKSVEWVDKAGITRKEKVRSPSIESNGYWQLIMIGPDITKPHRVHRLIASAFIPNPENKPFINHKNGIKTDNRIENLEWCTRSENIKHSFSIGTSCNKGELSPRSKMTNEQVLEIRKRYKPNGEYSTNRLAKEFNISKTNIKDIVNRKIWTHI